MGRDALYNALIQAVKEYGAGLTRGETLGVLNAFSNAVSGAVRYANYQERMDAVLQHLKEKTPDE